MPILFQKNKGDGLFTPNRFAYQAAPNVMPMGGAESAPKAEPGKLAQAGNWLLDKYKWLGTPKSILGLPKLPLVIPVHGSIAAVKGIKALNKGATNIALNATHPVINLGKTVGGGATTLGGALATDAWNLTAAPAGEALKSAFIDVPKRAIVNNTRIGLAALFGIFDLAAGTLNAGWQTLTYPVRVPYGLLTGAKRAIWDMPKTLIFDKDPIAAIKKPLEPIISSLASAPLAIAKVPYNIAMDAGIYTAAIASNNARLALTPLESIVNGYCHMSKAFNPKEENTIQTIYGAMAAGSRRAEIANIINPWKEDTFKITNKLDGKGVIGQIRSFVGQRLSEAKNIVQSTAAEAQQYAAAA